MENKYQGISFSRGISRLFDAYSIPSFSEGWNGHQKVEKSQGKIKFLIFVFHRVQPLKKVYMWFCVSTNRNPWNIKKKLVNQAKPYNSSVSSKLRLKKDVGQNVVKNARKAVPSTELFQILEYLNKKMKSNLQESRFELNMFSLF